MKGWRPKCRIERVSTIRRRCKWLPGWLKSNLMRKNMRKKKNCRRSDRKKNRIDLVNWTWWRLNWGKLTLSTSNTRTSITWIQPTSFSSSVSSSDAIKSTLSLNWLVWIRWTWFPPLSMCSSCTMTRPRRKCWRMSWSWEEPANFRVWSRDFKGIWEGNVPWRWPSKWRSAKEDMRGLFRRCNISLRRRKSSWKRCPTKDLSIYKQVG